MKLLMAMYEIGTYAFITYCFGQVSPFLAYALVAFAVYQVITSVESAYRKAKFVSEASKAFEEARKKEKLDALMGRDAE